MNPQTQKTKAARVAWHQSLVFRIGIMAAGILFLGLVTSVIVAVDRLDTSFKLVYDEEIQKALTTLLERIKEVHTLRQALILEKLKDLPELENRRNSTLSASKLEAYLRSSSFAGLIEPKSFKVLEVATSSSEDDRRIPLHWMDRENLKVLNCIIQFSKGETFSDFKAAEAVKQRYELIGATLKQEIRPYLIGSNIVILLAIFVFLAFGFILVARWFARRVADLVHGLEQWSEPESEFRFNVANWHGELALIASRFNDMADEVEANRRQSMFLEKIASWQTIARKIAHEIKNPLTPIQMMVSQLKRRYAGEDQEYQKLLDNSQEIISEEITRLRRLVDSFSHFAKLPTPSPVAVDLLVVFRQIVDLEKSAFPQHEIAVQSGLNSAVAEVDEGLIRQVLINLIKNAGEAFGDKNGQIVITVEDSGFDLIVKVIDNGSGIPEEIKAKMFEAYVTTKDTGPSPGMGLGLVICRKIMMDHGGEISVRSRPGETVFTLKIPKKSVVQHARH